MSHRCLLVCFVCKEAKLDFLKVIQLVTILKRLKNQCLKQSNGLFTQVTNYIMMVKWFETILYKIQVRKIAIITLKKYLVISAKQILILNVATVKGVAVVIIFFFNVRKTQFHN